jgi:hypothetical protein
MWSSAKNGYNAAYDPHFDRFERHMAAQQRGARQFSPRSISAGDLIHFLQAQQAEGKSYAFIKEAAGSVSMAVFEGSDGAIHLGKQTSMVKFLKSVRLKQPVGPRKASVPEYFDVALLFGEAWKFGPNQSLCLGHLKEKLLILLLVDTAARPSDVARIYRIMSGRHSQIVFEGRDMRLRYFWPKEVDPGSSRKNATNIYFSTWVKVCGSTPDSIDTVACMREFLARSSDATICKHVHCSVGWGVSATDLRPSEGRKVAEIVGGPYLQRSTSCHGPMSNGSDEDSSPSWGFNI